MDKPIIPRLCVLADTRSGMILSQDMVTPEENEVDIIFGTLINYILQIGKPKQIVVRDDYSLSVLTDLCKKIGIDIIKSGQLQAIDEFVESFYRFMF